MNSFDYKRLKCTNKFYQALLGYKFNADFMNRCLTRRKCRDCAGGKGKIEIYQVREDKDVLLYENHIKSPREREEFLFAFAFLYREYDNLRIVDSIGFASPIIEDMCKAANIKYVTTKGLSTEKKDYLYETRMHEYYHQWAEVQ